MEKYDIITRIMAMTPEGGYRAPDMHQETVGALQNFVGMSDRGVHYIQPGHIFMWRPTNRPGVPTLVNALQESGGKFTFAAFSNYSPPEQRHIDFIPPSSQVEMVPFGEILESYEPSEEAKKSYDAYGARDRAWIYLALHSKALGESLKNVGFENPIRYLDELITSELLRRTHIIDKRVGNWVAEKQLGSLASGYFPIVDFDDSVATMVTRTRDGRVVRADMWNNHNPIPSVEDFDGLPPKMRAEMRQLFKGRIENSALIGVHTRRDADKLTNIASHLRIPIRQRADIFVRHLIPPHFAEIDPQEVQVEDAADFMKKAIARGRIIAGAVQRVDFIKMDPTVLNGFEAMIDNLVQTETGKEILKNFRVALVAEGGAVDVRNTTKELFQRYADHVHERIAQINTKFKDIMQSIEGATDEDFIMANRDENGRLTGILHQELGKKAYPFYDISFQLGEEGLCQTVQEANIIRLFGIKDPKPPVLVISRSIGFSEKTEDFGFPNVKIVEDQTSGTEFTDKFVEAYYMAKSIREYPDSGLLEESQKAMAAFGDAAGKSFYADALNALYDAKQRRLDQ